MHILMHREAHGEVLKKLKIHFSANLYAIFLQEMLNLQVENILSRPHTAKRSVHNICGCRVRQTQHPNNHKIVKHHILTIATMACKAAVKANDRLSIQEATAMIEKLLQLENPFTCPHGRPTIIEMTQYELEKRFKRIQN